MRSVRPRRTGAQTWCRPAMTSGPGQRVSVTLLMTDIVGSTAFWERDPIAMSAALRRHDDIIGCAVRAHCGSVIKQHCGGDGTFAVFRAAGDAVAAAVMIQRRCLRAAWPTSQPLRLRAAIHSGAVEHRRGDYFGTEVNRCARLCAVAEPGAVWVSSAAAGGVPATLAAIDRGAVALRDLTEAVQVFHVDLGGQLADTA